MKPDTTVPRNTEAEEAVLGALLIDPRAIERVDWLTPEMFYLQKNRWIYDAMLTLHERRAPVDLLTLSSELDARGQGEAVDVIYIAELINAVPSSVNVESYAGLVRDTWTRRRLLDAAAEVARAAYNEEQPVSESVTAAERAVFNVRSEEATGPSTAAEVTLAVWKTLEQARNADRPLAVNTGIKTLDDRLGGLIAGDLIIVGGRAGDGKTALALNNIAEHVMSQGRGALVFSLEMLRESLVQRMVSTRTRIPIQRLRAGTLHDDEYPLVSDALGQISELPLIIEAGHGMTVSSIRAKTMRVMRQHDLGLIVVDYLQKIIPNRQHKNRNDLELAETITGLSDVALEFKTPLLCITRLNGSADQRPRSDPPTRADIFGSSGVGYEADVILLIHRLAEVAPGTTTPTPANIIIDKNRNGPTGPCGVQWLPGQFRFTTPGGAL